jgi:hypothetical protein
MAAVLLAGAIFLVTNDRGVEAGMYFEEAAELAEQGDDASLRLACHLVEWAAQAEPESSDVHAARADVYRARRAGELSLMSKGIFGQAADLSKPHD